MYMMINNNVNTGAEYESESNVRLRFAHAAAQQPAACRAQIPVAPPWCNRHLAAAQP